MVLINFAIMNISQCRKTWLFGQCLSTKSTPEIVNFDASGLLGGIIYKGQKPGVYMKEPGSDPDPGLGIPGIVRLNSIQKLKVGLARGEGFYKMSLYVSPHRERRCYDVAHMD